MAHNCIYLHVDDCTRELVSAAKVGDESVSLRWTVYWLLYQQQLLQVRLFHAIVTHNQSVLCKVRILPNT